MAGVRGAMPPRSPQLASLTCPSIRPIVRIALMQAIKAKINQSLIRLLFQSFVTCSILVYPSLPQAIKSKINALQQAVMKIGSSLSGQGGAGGSENVQDAEVKDKKE